MPTRRLFGSVRKLPSGRWQASYWHKGERHVARGTFAVKTDAFAFLSTKETDILRGEWVDPSAGKIAFADFASQWLTNQSHLRPLTVELSTGSHINATFGQRQLSAITNSQVVAWYRALAARLPGTAPKAYRLMAGIMPRSRSRWVHRSQPC